MVQQNENQLCIFSLGQSLYAIDSLAISYVTPCPAITYVPGCPKEILGIVHLKGSVEAVIDLNILLDQPLQTQEKARSALLLQVGEFRAALLVDTVEDLLTIDSDHYQEIPLSISDKLRKWVSAVFQFKERPVILLNTEEIVAHLERSNA